MELTKWIESEMNIEFSQSQLLGDDITTEDLINIIMDNSSSTPAPAPAAAAPAPVAAPVAVQPRVAPAPVAAPVAVQPRSFQPVAPVAAPVSVQPRVAPVAAPAPVAAAKPSSGLNKDKLTKDITDKLQSMLGLIDEEIDVTIPLRVYGLDSLTAMELTKWIESEMNIEFSQSQLLGDDITTEDLINIIMDNSSSAPAPAPAPVAAPVATPVVPTPLNVKSVGLQSVNVQPTMDQIYQDIPTIQPVDPKVDSNVDREALKNEICTRLQNMLGLVDEEIDPAIPLRVYGLDSLTSMELTNWIQSELKVTLPQSQLLSDEITTNELVTIVANLLSNTGDNSYYNDNKVLKPSASIADSESTVDASFVQNTESLLNDDLLKKRNVSSGTKQQVINALKGEVISKLQDLLGLVDEDIDTNVPLQVYGLDSLTSMEIVKWIENDKHVDLPQSALLNSEITTEELLDMIATKITGEDSAKTPTYDQYMDNAILI